MNEPLAISNFLVIALTVLLSYRGFVDPRFEGRFIFWPQRILADREYHRLLTPAFLHANWTHLIFNMMSLYFFGARIELSMGAAQFLAIYFGGIAGGNLVSLYLHRRHDYRAYGASGGVCGIIFAHLFLFPGGSLTVFPFPFGIPSWLYAICFILGSFYGLKAQRDNIGHDAHLGGAICGLLIATALNPWIVSRSPRLFPAVLLLSLALFAWLLKNPLFLPARELLRSSFWKRPACSEMPTHKREEFRMDELLEKISEKGLDSLTPAERTFLNHVSRKYQSRAESTPPDSALPF